jgi:VCBS repeat-containing protein
VINSSDAPVIGGVDSGAVTEDVAVVGGNITASDSLTIADPDAGESSFIAATVNGSYGDLTIDSAGNWSYSADNSQVSIQALDAGESLTDTLTVTTFDGSTHDIVITINGAEDAAVIGGTAVGGVAEDGSLTVTDTLTITDVDTSDNPVSFNDVAATIGDNGYGDFEITGNSWTYTLNNGHASVQALDVGETLTDTYTFTASDGSTQTVTVTIDGAEDAPVLGGGASGNVTEDGVLIDGNTLTITDADSSDNPVSFNDVAATLGDNGYGNFEITSNTWTYTLNNGHASVQALDAGETLTDTYTFAASDGSTRTVTVTINGSEDAAVIGGTATGTVAEDGTPSASDTLTITDRRRHPGRQRLR